MRSFDDETSSVHAMAKDLFCAGAITCALYALHRIANGLLLRSQLKAYENLVDAYTPEEREMLIHRVKTRSLRY